MRLLFTQNKKLSLLEAILSNNVQKVREEINKNELNQTLLFIALLEASEQGYLEIVNIFINMVENVNIGTYSGTPLGQAAYQGHLDVVQRLIEAGADVNYSPNISENKTPLILAIYEGHFDIVKIFIKAGANVNQEVRETGEFALMVAAACGYEEIYNYLAPLTNPELRLEAEKLLPEGILQRQREEKADPLVINLSSAVVSNNLDEVREILANNVDINGFNEYGTTALWTAAISLSVPLVKMLLEAGADPNLAREDTGETPLMASIGASENARLTSSLLISAGADVNAQKKDGTTSLMIAAQFGNLEMIQRFIQAGADINVKDNNGKSALNYAQEAGHNEIVQCDIL